MSSAALKVGDRVHVEFEGALKEAPYLDRLGCYAVEFEPKCVYTVRKEWVTKIADAEPEWAEGDVIVIRGHVLAKCPNSQRTDWLVLKAAPTSALHPGDHWPVSAVSYAWRDGTLQRLVPEAQK